MSSPNQVFPSRAAFARSFVGLLAFTVLACSPAPAPSPTLSPTSPTPTATLVKSEVIPGSWTLVSFGAPW